MFFNVELLLNCFSPGAFLPIYLIIPQSVHAQTLESHSLSTAMTLQGNLCIDEEKQAREVKLIRSFMNTFLLSNSALFNNTILIFYGKK